MADDTPITNPFAGPVGAVPQEPERLEVKTPPQAPERPEHPDLPELLRLADLGGGVTTDEHKVALEKLLTILRQQVNELRRGERRLIELALARFFERVLAEQGLSALVSANPGDAAEFLYGPRKRGKRASSTTAERDLQITREVVELMESGMNLFDATSTVAERSELSGDRKKLSRERVEKIYECRRRQVRLENAHI
jgi:hypothetical protein